MTLYQVQYSTPDGNTGSMFVANEFMSVAILKAMHILPPGCTITKVAIAGQSKPKTNKKRNLLEKR